MVVVNCKRGSVGLRCQVLIDGRLVAEFSAPFFSRDDEVAKRAIFEARLSKGTEVKVVRLDGLSADLTMAQIAMVRAQLAIMRRDYSEALGHALRARILASRTGDEETFRIASGLIKFATKRLSVK